MSTLKKRMWNIASDSENGNLNPAVLIDFDDTAAEQNVGELLLNQFGDSSWLQLRDRFQLGEINLKEYQESAFRNIQASRATMKDYVKRHAKMRPYFKDLWNYCRAEDIPMAIVSYGLDFYIEALLEKEGFDQVPVYAVHTNFTARGISYDYPYAYSENDGGNHKTLLVNQYRRQGYHVIYVGDGHSDFSPATRADLVFAHGTLAEECHHYRIPFRAFRNFQNVLMTLKKVHSKHTSIQSG
jgi:2-hydroxy-3-keto-5-methylthiopentenyl-1-phosphate phosphatase